MQAIPIEGFAFMQSRPLMLGDKYKALVEVSVEFLLSSIAELGFPRLGNLVNALVVCRFNLLVFGTRLGF